MLRQAFIFFAFFISGISCGCVRYTFEDDVEYSFTNKSSLCIGLGLWDLGYYNATNLTGQNEKSESFISPRVMGSCGSSFMFTMTAGGIIEVNTYMKSADKSDQIAILAIQYVANGDNRVVGLADNWATNSDFVSGWHTMRINLTGNGVYDGYIAIMGIASRYSTVLVDSFRYVPPDMDERLCRLYEDDVLTTEPPVTTTQPPATPETTTQPPVTTTQQPLTTTQPSATTTQSPLTTTQPSATTTQSPLTTTQPPDTTTQSPLTTTQPPDTTTQSPLTTTQVPDTTTQSPMTTTQAPDTTTQSPLTTTQPPDTTTQPPLTTTQPSVTMPDTTTQLPATTTQPEHGCVRYTFENNFHELFTNELEPCLGMEFWDRKYYNTTDLTSQNKRSESFISPRESLSCVSSFMFPMKGGGLIEVNTYMESADQLDQITILAHQYVDGNLVVAGRYTNVPNANFASGWQNIRFNLRQRGTHTGYITFMGMASQNSIVLVDSFRYVPPNMKEKLCRLYEKVANTI